MQALDNAARSDSFTVTLDQIRQNGGTLTVRVTEVHPDWFENSLQAAGVRIRTVDQTGPNPIQDVEIVIIGSRIGTGADSFANRLAHEITHTFRNLNGSFYT